MLRAVKPIHGGRHTTLHPRRVSGTGALGTLGTPRLVQEWGSSGRRRTLGEDRVVPCRDYGPSGPVASGNEWSGTGHFLLTEVLGDELFLCVLPRTKRADDSPLSFDPRHLVCYGRFVKFLYRFPSLVLSGRVGTYDPLSSFTFGPRQVVFLYPVNFFLFCQRGVVSFDGKYL